MTIFNDSCIEILHEIFLYFSWTDLHQNMRVCRLWKKVCDNILNENEAVDQAISCITSLIKSQDTFSHPLANNVYNLDATDFLYWNIFSGFSVSAVTVVKCLLERKFDINRRGSLDNSLIHIFIFDLPALHELLVAGIELNVADYNGFTALHILCINYESFVHRFGVMDYQLLTVLADYNFNFQAKDNTGKLAIEHFERKSPLPVCEQELVFLAYLALYSGIAVLEFLDKHIKDKLALFLFFKNYNFFAQSVIPKTAEYNLIAAGELLTNQPLSTRINMCSQLLSEGKLSFLLLSENSAGSNIDLLKFVAHPHTLTEICQGLISLAKGDVNHVYCHGYTLLHIMLSIQAFETALWLINEGADINIQDFSGNTPLHLLFKQVYFSINLTTVLAWLSEIRLTNYNFTTKNKLEKTAVDVFLRRVDGDELEKVFKPYKNLLITMTMYSYTDPLYKIQCMLGSGNELYSEVKKTLSNKAVSFFAPHVVTNSMQALAAKPQQQINAVQFWVKMAMRLELTEEVLKSFSLEERLTIQTYRTFGLLTNSYNRHSILYLEDGTSYRTDPNEQMGYYHDKVKQTIYPFKLLEIVNKMIELKLSFNVRNCFKQTFLHIFITQCDIDVLQVLLTKGVDINAVDNFGQSAIFNLLEYFLGNNEDEKVFDIIKFLLTKKLDLNCYDNQSETPADFLLLSRDLEDFSTTKLQVVAFVIANTWSNPFIVLKGYFSNNLPKTQQLFELVKSYQHCKLENNKRSLDESFESVAKKSRYESSSSDIVVNSKMVR